MSQSKFLIDDDDELSGLSDGTANLNVSSVKTKQLTTVKGSISGNLTVAGGVTIAGTLTANTAIFVDELQVG